MNEITENKILLSVCVAVYNIKEEYLRACVESLVSDKNDAVEILLGDDGSGPETAEVCRKYAENDSRIRYIRQEKNGGVSSIRNIMIKAARGRVITFMDGDDAAAEGYLTCICDALGKCGTEYDIVMFRWRRFEGAVPQIPAESAEIRRIPPEAARRFSQACLTGEPPHAEDFGIADSTPSSVCIKAYRRGFLIDNGLSFKVGLKKSQDVVFNTRAYFFCKSLGYLPQTLYLYRINPGSVTNRYSADLYDTIRDCIGCDTENMKELFGGDAAVLKKWRMYKLIHYAINNFSLNIFHKDNPKKMRERRKDFLEFIRTEPFGSFFKSFDFSSYDWRERRLILKLASCGRFKTLDIMYRLPLLLKTYGKVGNIFNKIRKRRG